MNKINAKLNDDQSSKRTAVSVITHAFSQSVSGTLDRPRVVAPSKTCDCAILQASLALSPVSSSICCTHVRQGRPRWRFHSGLMSGYRLCERPQPGVVRSGLVSFPVVAARDVTILTQRTLCTKFNARTQSDAT